MTKNSRLQSIVKASFDFGNSYSKFSYATSDGIYSNTTATYLVELTAHEAKQFGGEGSNPDIYEVNDKIYAIGEIAKRRTVSRLQGAARYTPNQIGVMFAICAFDAFTQSENNIYLTATHPPRDSAYRPMLAEAIKGTEWTVEHCGQVKRFQVQNVKTLSEPLAGLMCYSLDMSGNGSIGTRKVISNNGILVIDIGGYTTDMIMVYPGLNIDIGSGSSLTLGFNDLIHQARTQMRETYPDVFLNLPDYDEMFIREMFGRATGRIYAKLAGKAPEKWPDVTSIVNELSLSIVAQVRDATLRYMSSGRVDTILLTGGGCDALHDRLKIALDHTDIVLADTRGRMQTANSKGGVKWQVFVEAMREQK